jgi:hypothetical protein
MTSGTRHGQPVTNGWPYFVADNKPYHDYDFASGTSGPPFDPALPQNHSPNNTGPANLPPARPAWIWYPYGNSAEFPEITGGAGRTAMAGPVYHYSSAAPSNNRRLPAYYEGSLFIYEWSRNFIREVKLDETGISWPLIRSCRASPSSAQWT